MNFEVSSSSLKEFLGCRFSGSKCRRAGGEASFRGEIEIEGGSYRSVYALRDFNSAHFYVERFNADNVDDDAFGNNLSLNHFHLMIVPGFAGKLETPVPLASFTSEAAARRALRRAQDVMAGNSMPRFMRYALYLFIAWTVMSTVQAFGVFGKYAGMPVSAAQQQILRDQSRLGVPHNPYELAKEPRIQRPDPNAIFGGSLPSDAGAGVGGEEAAPQGAAPQGQGSNPFFKD